MSDTFLNPKSSHKQKTIETVENNAFVPVELKQEKPVDQDDAQFDSKEVTEEKPLLTLADEELMDERILMEQTRVQGGRKSAKLLLGNRKITSDNKEMQEVKESIIALEELLSKPFDADGFDDKFINMVEKSYNTLIQKCQTYIDNKNPHFSKGIERKRLVTEHKEAMEKELAAFKEGVSFVKKNSMAPYVRSNYDLLCSSKLEYLINHKDIRISVQLYNDTTLSAAVQTPEFINVCNTLKVINMILKEPFPLRSTVGARSQDGTAQVDELSFITMKQNRLLEEIAVCLERGCNGDQELYNQLVELQKQCRADQEFMQNKVENYRTYLRDHPIEASSATWNDAIGFTRAVTVDVDDEEKYQVNKLGAATSVVYRIEEKDGDKVVFFQQEQNTSISGNFVNDYVSQFTGYSDEKSLALHKEIIQKYFDSCDPNGDLTKAAKMMKAYGKKFKDDDKAMAASILKKLKIDRKQINEDLDSLGMMLRGFGKFLAQQVVCSWAGISQGSRLTGRNVAASRLARLFGFSGSICESRSAVVKQNGKQIKGNIMDDSDGETVVELYNGYRGQVEYEDQAVSDLMDLRVFDFICGQIDRHNGNIHLDFDGSKVTGIKGIDNDMCFGEYKYEDIIKEGHSFQKKFDPMMLDGLSDSFIRHLDSLSRPVVDAMLCDLLTQRELDALWSRLSGIQEALRNRGDLLKNAKDKKKGANRKKNEQYIRQYQALQSMREKGIEDEQAFDSRIFSTNYIYGQMIRLRRKAPKT